jgi:hypothetical protein
MGNHRDIRYDRWPKQGDWLHKRVKVVFHYDLTHQMQGTIVRDDREHPHRMIIRLDDGRYVLPEECQWSLPPLREEER